MRMGEPCRPPALGRVLPLLPPLLVLVSVCGSSPAVVAKGSNNRSEETKSPQGIPGVTVPVGKIFHYPVPALASQGTLTQYKVMIFKYISWYSPAANIHFVFDMNSLEMPSWKFASDLLETLRNDGKNLPIIHRRGSKHTTPPHSVCLTTCSLNNAGSWKWPVNAAKNHPKQALCENQGTVVSKIPKWTIFSSCSWTSVQSELVIYKTGVVTPFPISNSASLREQVTLASSAALPKWLEFNSTTNTLQGLPMAGEGGRYLLSIAASGRIRSRETPGAAANFSIHVQDSSLSLDLEYKPNSHQCGKEAAITSAEIILSAGAEALEIQERLSLVCTMAEYLHLEPSLLTLLQFPGPAPRGSQSLAVLAEHVDFTGNPQVGLSWPVRCGGFATLHGFIQVLQRNVDSQHLSRLLGYGIAGWRILRRGDYGRRSARRQRRGLMITPTPTLKPIRVTQGPAAGEAPRPLAFTVPSPSLTQLVASPTQSSSPFWGGSVTIASGKMQNNIQLVSQERSVTLGMGSAWDTPTNPSGSVMFADSDFPDLSPSLVTGTRFLLTELEVLPTGASGMSLLSEQLEPHLPEADSYLLSNKSEVSTPHPLQDITSGTEQLSRLVDTWVTKTAQEWPHSSAEAFPPKTHFHVSLPEATSASAVPDCSDRAKSHFPELQMLSSASLSPETPSPEAPGSFPGVLTSTVLSKAPSVSSSGTKELHSNKDVGTRGVLPNVTKPPLEPHQTSGIQPAAAEAPLVTLFNATPQLPSSTPGVVQTLLPSHQDPSTWLGFPTSESLKLMESAWIFPPVSASQGLQTITQGQANTSPKVVHSITPLTATIGRLFFFPVPANTFHDEEDGNSTGLSLRVAPADGSPAGSESWLQFNTSQQAMHGYPLDVDLQYSPQEFVLSAVDSGGLTACESFTVELLEPTEAPCHVYTVRAKNSYCSFLRERSRLGLFLEKLSLYLSSSSPGDMVVTALRPGSTLISWYNSSLCARADGSRCARDEIQGALEKLGVPGGSISPHFVQAMLPEYEIDVIFSISYGGLCSATTRPFHGHTLQARNDSMVRETPNPLLSSLCATVGVLLVILVCWLCKCPRRIPGSQNVLFQRSSRSGRADVELDVLKPRKAPVHECRPSAPPPLGTPPGAPLTSPNQCPRAIPLPHITPPKYQLPPLYREGVTTHHGNSQRLKGRTCK